MREIEKDSFYDFVKQYDPNSEYYMAGEVHYHLLQDDKAYEGFRDPWRFGAFRRGILWI